MLASIKGMTSLSWYILVCFLESVHTGKHFPNKTFVSVNKCFIQKPKWRILKPAFVLPAYILFQSLQLNKWVRFKRLPSKSKCRTIFRKLRAEQKSIYC